MDWDKHDIDHKVPLTWFTSETPPHIVNDLRNLQPLDRNLNKSKSNSYSSKIDPDYYNVILKWVKEEYKKDLAF
jgi:hypothetical protein